VLGLVSGSKRVKTIKVNPVIHINVQIVHFHPISGLAGFVEGK
jgi:hypothetical protein